MTRLSDKQIAGAVQAAGFPASSQTVAVAVALAESGGNPDATNHNTNGSTDYGLFQINSIHSELLNSHNWRDPVDNARMALAISGNGSSWSPWVAYTTGRYRAYLPRAKRATGNPASPPQSVAGSGTVEQAGFPTPGDFGRFASFVSDPHTWLRFLAIILGFGLVLIGLAQASGASKPLAAAARFAVTKGVTK